MKTIKLACMVLMAIFIVVGLCADDKNQKSVASEKTIRYFANANYYNRPPSMSHELDSGSLEDVTLYYIAHYNKEQRLVELHRFNKGMMDVIRKYEYHVNGRLSKEAWSNLTGKKTSGAQWYDKKGGLLRNTWYNEKGEVIRDTQYDGNGKIIKEEKPPSFPGRY